MLKVTYINLTIFDVGMIGLFLQILCYIVTAPVNIYTLSLHDALPISPKALRSVPCLDCQSPCSCCGRSEEHTSELQSHVNLVCRLLLEKKKMSIVQCVR